MEAGVGAGFSPQKTFQSGGLCPSLREAVGFRRFDGSLEATPTSLACSYGLLLRLFSLLLLWKQPAEGLLRF